MDRTGIPPRNQPDEIDLVELVRALWKGKWVILGITAIVTCIAVAYALLATPTYQATVRMLPPSANGLVSYNAAGQLTGQAIGTMLSGQASEGIQSVSPSDVYAAFLTQLKSLTVRQQFFEKYYLPAMSKETKASTQRLWKRLDKQLSIIGPKQDDPSSSLSLDGHNPKRIADWSNKYAKLAIDQTRTELLENLKGEVSVRLNGLNEQITTSRNVAKEMRDAQITRLRNALQVAQSIGLETPPDGVPLIPVGNGSDNALNGGDLMYLRGARALRSELDLLEKRQNDDAYIPELPDLFKQQALLNSVDLDPSHLSVVRIDALAEVPEDPIKPRKTLIVALGLIVGMILGICFVLARLMFTKE